MRPVVKAAVVVGLVFVSVGLSAGPVQATTGPYTLPFFDDVDSSQGYGCTTFNKEPVWSGFNADGIEYPCDGNNKYFHKGIDYQTGTDGVIASSDNGVVKRVYNLATGNACGGSPTHGNHVIVKHDATHWTIYYHLKHNSITVQEDQQVSAGQKLGVSGNTGNSCGAHLHYELMTCLCDNSDPWETYRPFGKWTTSPGRVPWLAELVSQSSGTDICQGSTVNHWVQLRNIGGRSWKSTNDGNENGRVTLRSTDSAGTEGVATALAAADWEDSIVAGPADQTTVSPDAIGYFGFGLKGNGTAGNTYVVRFNLRALNLRWFDRAYHNFSKSVFIVPPQAC